MSDLFFDDSLEDSDDDDNNSSKEPSKKRSLNDITKELIQQLKDNPTELFMTLPMDPTPDEEKKPPSKQEHLKEKRESGSPFTNRIYDINT